MVTKPRDEIREILKLSGFHAFCRPDFNVSSRHFFRRFGLPDGGRVVAGDPESKIEDPHEDHRVSRKKCCNFYQPIAAIHHVYAVGFHTLSVDWNHVDPATWRRAVDYRIALFGCFKRWGSCKNIVQKFEYWSTKMSFAFE